MTQVLPQLPCCVARLLPDEYVLKPRQLTFAEKAQRREEKAKEGFLAHLENVKDGSLRSRVFDDYISLHVARDFNSFLTLLSHLMKT